MSGWRKRTILDLAREAGIRDCTCSGAFGCLEAFANLVREEATTEANARANASWTLMCKKMVAAEREACAKVCDELPAPDIYNETDKFMWDVFCMEYAAAIRARGEQA